VAKLPQLGRGSRRPGEKTCDHDGEDHKLIRPGPRINPIEQQVHAIHDPILRPHPVPRFACLRRRVYSPKLGSRLGGSLGWAAAGGLVAIRTASLGRGKTNGLRRGAITKKFVRLLLKMCQGRLGRHIAQCSHPWARQSGKGAVATRRPWLFGRTPNTRGCAINRKCQGSQVPGIARSLAGAADRLGQAGRGSTRGVCPSCSRKRCGLARCAALKVVRPSSCASTRGGASLAVLKKPVACLRHACPRCRLRPRETCRRNSASARQALTAGQERAIRA
jgi:hypothetical protein